MNVTVAQARNGKGVFAARDLVPGETAYEVTGEFITCDEDDEVDEKTRANTFRFDEDRYISPAGTVGDLQNHSCEPNAKVQKRDGRLYVVAVAPIRKGEEVVIDYSTIIAADDSWEMVCNCGAQTCRGIVRSFDTLPASLRERYLKDSIVPEYILATSS